MVNRSHKDPLEENQRLAINYLHSNQIIFEIILVIFVYTIFTINLSSISNTYGVIDGLIMLLSVLVLFVFGIIITTTAFRLRKLGEPIRSNASRLTRWLIMTWCWIPVFIAIAILAVAIGAPPMAATIILSVIIICFLITVVFVLVTIQLLWKRFTKRKRTPVRLILYSFLCIVTLLVSVFGTYTITESVPYNSTTISDSNLELGQSEVRQVGKDGQKQTTHTLFFGSTKSTSQIDAVDQITAKGSRRYQYMYCSNGSYRYYTADQFKDPTVGFTHQSPDNCAKNGEGTETTIADTPPAQTIIQQAPSYHMPTYHSTTCNAYSFTNSITCSGYY